jgi:hypothetical protein
MSFGHCQLGFGEFEKFMMCLSANPEYLRVTTAENNSYVNAHRWEEFFLKYFPSIRHFYF